MWSHRLNQNEFRCAGCGVRLDGRFLVQNVAVYCCWDCAEGRLCDCAEPRMHSAEPAPATFFVAARQPQPEPASLQ